MGKKGHIDDRDWNRRPLFGGRRRRYAHWILLVVLLIIGALLFLFPSAVKALLAPLFA